MSSRTPTITSILFLSIVFLILKSKEPNANSAKDLLKIQEAVIQNLETLTFVPYVQMRPLPEDALKTLNDESLGRDMANLDVRLHPSIMDRVVQDAGEYYDDGRKEGEDRRNEHNAKRAVESSSSDVESKRVREQ